MLINDFAIGASSAVRAPRMMIAMVLFCSFGMHS